MPDNEYWVNRRSGSGATSGSNGARPLRVPFRAAVKNAGLRRHTDGVDMRWTDDAMLELLGDLAYRRARPLQPADLDEG